jgi:hypothetical protein
MTVRFPYVYSRMPDDGYGTKRRPRLWAAVGRKPSFINGGFVAPRLCSGNRFARGGRLIDAPLPPDVVAYELPPSRPANRGAKLGERRPFGHPGTASIDGSPSSSLRVSAARDLVPTLALG